MSATTNEDLNRKWALMQLQQGSDASPVRHWTQALARVAQGALGGYFLGQEDRADKEASAALTNLPGLGGGAAADVPAASPTGPDKVTAALAQPAPGAAPANGGSPVANALSAKPSVSIPPDVASTIRTLIANPRTQAQGLAMYGQYTKPSDYGFTSAGDVILRTDSRTGAVTPVYRGASKPTLGTVKLPNGEEVSAWIDPSNRSASPVQMPGMASSAPQSVTGPDGNPVQIPPGVDPKVFRNHMSAAAADAASGKMTEVQANSTQFANRMMQAESSFGKVSDYMTNGGLALNKDRAMRGVTEGQYNPVPRAATNWAVSDSYQQGEQAKSQFITALLRRESGANITPAEFSRYDQEFFPQPGDGAKVIEQKKAARAVAIEAMKKAAGPAFKQVMPTAAPAGNNDPLGLR